LFGKCVGMNSEKRHPPQRKHIHLHILGCGGPSAGTCSRSSKWNTRGINTLSLPTGWTCRTVRSSMRHTHAMHTTVHMVYGTYFHTSTTHNAHTTRNTMQGDGEPGDLHPPDNEQLLDVGSCPRRQRQQQRMYLLSCHLHLLMCFLEVPHSSTLTSPHLLLRSQRPLVERALLSPNFKKDYGPHKYNVLIAVRRSPPRTRPCSSLPSPHLAPFPVCSHHVLLLLMLQDASFLLNGTVSNTYLKLQDPDLDNFKHWYTVCAFVVVCDLTSKVNDLTCAGVPGWLWVGILSLWRCARIFSLCLSLRGCCC
jgi:hypothetical protein